MHLHVHFGTYIVISPSLSPVSVIFFPFSCGCFGGIPVEPNREYIARPINYILDGEQPIQEWWYTEYFQRQHKQNDEVCEIGHPFVNNPWIKRCRIFIFFCREMIMMRMNNSDKACVLAFLLTKTETPTANAIALVRRSSPISNIIESFS